eukprot:gnl/MRDRNA2_/MRDRNA2_84870_c1_seq5.p1 gnl/MRDRNA2_/MRDRNA2_84870_c1~~gnl/MRDRNA2_/MRDRNA2_84870_c1_seq5.p1  ORF type:complete len:547 (+),score=48.06 gnl/MRDRNA2_/MRDRNA2_84870_c1_seq5:66-1706(+)
MVKFGHILKDKAAELEREPLCVHADGSLLTMVPLSAMAKEYKELKKIIKKVEQDLPVGTPQSFERSSENLTPNIYNCDIPELPGAPVSSARQKSMACLPDSCTDSKSSGEILLLENLPSGSHGLRATFVHNLESVLHKFEDAFAQLPTVSAWEQQFVRVAQRKELKAEAECIATYCWLIAEGVRKITKKYDKRCGGKYSNMQPRYSERTKYLYNYSDQIRQILACCSATDNEFVMVSDIQFVEGDVSDVGEVTCPICIGDVPKHASTALELSIQLPCGHIFHRRCIANQVFKYVELARSENPQLQARARGGVCCSMCRQQVTRLTLYESLFDYVFFLRHRHCSHSAQGICDELEISTGASSLPTAQSVYDAWRECIARLTRSEEMQKICGHECNEVGECIDFTYIYQAADSQIISVHAMPQQGGEAVNESPSRRYWNTLTSDMYDEVSMGDRMDNILDVALNCKFEETSHADVLGLLSGGYLERFLPLPLQGILRHVADIELSPRERGCVNLVCCCIMVIPVMYVGVAMLGVLPSVSRCGDDCNAD